MGVREWVGATGHAVWSQTGGQGRGHPDDTGCRSWQCGLAVDEGKLRMYSKLVVQNSGSRQSICILQRANFKNQPFPTREMRAVQG